MQCDEVVEGSLTGGALKVHAKLLAVGGRMCPLPRSPCLLQWKAGDDAFVVGGLGVFHAIYQSFMEACVQPTKTG